MKSDRAAMAGGSEKTSGGGVVVVSRRQMGHRRCYPHPLSLSLFPLSWCLLEIDVGFLGMDDEG